MTRRERLFLALALAPLVIGGLLALLLSLDVVPDPPLMVWVVNDSAGMFFTGGIVLTVLLAPIALGLRRARVRQQRAEDRVRQSLTAQHHTFLGRLDHEVKNLLLAIVGRMEDLEAGELAPEQRRALASARDQAERLRQLTSDLHRIADLETCHLLREPLDVAALVEEVRQMAQEGFRAYAAVLGDRVLETEVRTAPGRPLAVMGDHKFLVRVLYNLVSNACKYSPPGSTVKVRAFPERAEVHIEVEDEGPGIAGADRKHVGEQLFRAPATQHIPGSGLGLAMAQTIVKRLGGRMILSSTEGAGTIAAIHLPAATSSPWLVVGEQEAG